MKKNLILYILLVVLIVVNVFFLFHFLGKNEVRMQKGNGGNPENFIAKELKFDDSQMKQFRDLSDAHREAMQTIAEETKVLKDDLFNKISEASVNDQDIDSITSLIGETEKAKDFTVFNHFRDIYDMCNESQKAKFNRIIKDAIHKGGPGGRPEGSPEGREGPPPPRP